MTVATKSRPRTRRKTPPPDPVTSYAKAVIAGKIIAGLLVRHACERHLRDLERDDLHFDTAAAQRAIDFFAQLKHSKGRWAGQPLVLEPWQAFIIGCMFGWKRPDGKRRFRDAYVSVARKNGKTTIAAGIALYLLDFDNEPGAEVYAAATKRDQARICWDEAARMVRKAGGLGSRVRIVDSRANMHVLETSSKFEALGADLDSLDGLNPHGGIIDELHAHRNRVVVDALETGAGAREQPLFLYITTAGLERESIYSEVDDYARRVVDGTVEDDGWFVYLATLDPDDDWTDAALYAKANPNLGVSIQLEELEAERDRALEVPGRVNTFKRLRLNTRTGQFSAWFTAQQWDACASEFRWEALRGKRCFAGLDLASRTDIAALVLVFPDPLGDGCDYVLPFFWVPAAMARKRAERDAVFGSWVDRGYITATEGDLIDYDVIRETAKDLAAEFEIVELGFDRWNATQLITQLREDGAECIEVGQGYASLSAPSKEIEGLIGAARLRHDGNPALRWMVLNVQKSEDPAGNMKPARDKSADKIDGFVALVVAESRAMVDNGESSISVYESKESLAL